MKRVMIWTPLVLLAALAVFALTPLGRYLARAGVAEARILLARRPIVDAIADSTTPPLLRDKLRLVQEARRFALEELNFEQGESFTQYTQLDRDTLVLVLSATPKDWLEQHTWWFPLVGRLPYKGFFDYERAKEEAAALETSGYDVNLRPAAAFSTLGWFNDPILSTTLTADSVDLVDTVIHELTHNTFFAKGQGVFNESLANFAGARGAELFFRMRGDSAAARDAVVRWRDTQVLGAYWAKLYRELDSAFRANAEDKDRRLMLRDSVFAAARRTLVDSLSKELQGVPVQYLERVRLDNAALMGRRVYATDLDVFDAVLHKEGGAENGGLMRALEVIFGIARENPADPAAALREFVEKLPARDTGAPILGGNTASPRGDSGALVQALPAEPTARSGGEPQPHSTGALEL